MNFCYVHLNFSYGALDKYREDQKPTGHWKHHKSNSFKNVKNSKNDIWMDYRNIILYRTIHLEVLKWGNYRLNFEILS